MNIMKSGLSLKQMGTFYSDDSNQFFYEYKIKYQPDYIKRGSGNLYLNQSCKIRSDSCPEIIERAFDYFKITIYIQGRDLLKDNIIIKVSEKNVSKVLRAITDFNNAFCKKNKTYTY